MERRISFFVDTATRSEDVWVVRGAVGLGPIEPGDEFTFVHHQDAGVEERLTLRVETLDEATVVVTPTRDVTLRHGDILGGEVSR